MRFNGQVIMQDLCGIPLVGNLSNGYVIGLTGEGAAVCARLMTGDVPAEEIAAADAALLAHLGQGGFFDEGARGDVGKGAEAAPVLSAYLHVTQRCNLRCRGCYSLDAHRNVLEDASLEDICHALDELAGAGVRRLVISGGEPFLRDDLPDIVAHAKRACGMGQVDVLSNGTRIAHALLERMAPYVDEVSVSFDGCSAESVPYIRREQRFDELVSAVRAIQAAGIRAHIIPTAHAKNIGELARYVALARDLGATMNFSLLTCEQGDPELGGLLPDDDDLRRLGRDMLDVGGGGPVLAMDAPVGVNLAFRRNCGAGTRTLSIDADGTIYPCHMLHRRELAMGNAFTGRLRDALGGDVAREMRSLHVEDFEGCSDCRHEYLCGGGCRARSLHATGSLRARDSYCAMICAFYDALGERMAASVGQAEGAA